MSRTQTQWLGKASLSGAIRAALLQTDELHYPALRAIADGSAIPDGCDPRFVQIARHLALEADPDPSCHPEFAGSWSYFLGLATDVVHEVRLFQFRPSRYRELLLRMQRIAKWRKTVAELEPLFAYAEPLGPNPKRPPAAPPVLSGYEAQAIWLTDPQTTGVLEQNTPPSVKLIPSSKRGHPSYLTLFGGLLEFIHRRVKPAGEKREELLLMLGEWFGNCDDWPGVNSNAYFCWPSDTLKLGIHFEHGSAAAKRRLAWAWPDLAHGIGYNREHPEPYWPRKAIEHWVRGVACSAGRDVSDDPHVAFAQFQATTEPLTRWALWQRFLARHMEYPKLGGNPFDPAVRLGHPFEVLGDATKPPEPTEAAARAFVGL